MSTLFAILIGGVLFVLFERKRFVLWRDKFLLMRRNAQNSRAGRALAAALDSAGFFDRLSEVEVGSVRTSIETYGYGGVFEHPWRATRADDEELAEGQVGEFLRRLSPSFEKLGVASLTGESRFADGGAHMLDLPGESITLISDDEARRDEPDLSRFSWGAVGARVLARLNAHLADAGLGDRFYSVYAGNDAQVLLLTPPMLSAITSTPGIRRDELPYIRTAQWPNFGMDVSSVVRRDPAN